MLSYLPHINAVLNALSAFLAGLGFVSIRRKKKGLHRACMISALILSALFLASYLTYHSEAGSIRLQKQGWIRPVYFTILVSHSVLAALLLPLVGFTLRHALAEKFTRHREIARWTLPVWVYVSITGILVYWILYR
jgi:uncharacterized membrane protein YozB (DUF420 family)